MHTIPPSHHYLLKNTVFTYKDFEPWRLTFLSEPRGEFLSRTCLWRTTFDLFCFGHNIQPLLHIYASPLYMLQQSFSYVIESIEGHGHGGLDRCTAKHYFPFSSVRSDHFSSRHYCTRYMQRNLVVPYPLSLVCQSCHSGACGCEVQKSTERRIVLEKKVVSLPNPWDFSVFRLRVIRLKKALFRFFRRWYEAEVFDIQWADILTD